MTFHDEINASRDDGVWTYHDPSDAHAVEGLSIEHGYWLDQVDDLIFGYSALKLKDKPREHMLEQRAEVLKAWRLGAFDVAVAEAKALHYLAHLYGKVTALTPDALRGRKTLTSAKKGHEVACGTPEEKRAKDERIWKTFDEVVAENPRWGKTLCYEEVAGRLSREGVSGCTSEKTIRRALKHRP